MCAIKIVINYDLRFLKTITLTLKDIYISMDLGRYSPPEGDSLTNLTSH